MVSCNFVDRSCRSEVSTGAIARVAIANRAIQGLHECSKRLERNRPGCSFRFRRFALMASEDACAPIRNDLTRSLPLPVLTPFSN